MCSCSRDGDLLSIWTGVFQRFLSGLGMLAASATPPTPPFLGHVRPTFSSGSARNLIVDVFMVALNQARDEESWYTSTKELQLASLEFCAACRSVATLALIVDGRVPRSLLATDSALLPPDRKRSCSSRVPRLRARRVRWNLPTAAELTRPIHSVAGATELDFGYGFVDSLEGVVWPRRLKKIRFHRTSVLYLPPSGVTWPTSLEQLRFGAAFNQPLCRVRWSTSLQELTFGENFDQSIEKNAWPPNLLRIRFGFAFNQPIEAVTWPNSLKQLWLGGRFVQPVEDVKWPAALQELTFGDSFNRSIAGVA